MMIKKNGKWYTVGKVVLAIIVTLALLRGTNSYAQCSPGFLGNDRPFILCTPFPQIDYINFFQVVASYQQIVLTPTDTIRRAGQSDTVVFHQVKLMVIATLPNGCKDTAILRAPFNVDPFPNLGNDSLKIICRGRTEDLTRWLSNKPFDLKWSLPLPELADTGRHYAYIETRDGCKDSAFYTIANFSPPILLGNDTVLFRQPGQTANLATVFKQSQFVSILWSTPTPNAAPAGLHWAIGIDSNQCRDTALVEVCARPALPDTTVKLCPGSTLSLYGIYRTPGLSLEFLNTFTPSAVGVGEYQMVATNVCGATDTANITVVAAVKPFVADPPDAEVCENETTNIQDKYSLGSLVPKWSIPNPQQAPPGIHRLIVTNADGCKDTSYVKVISTPKNPKYNDTTVYVCNERFKNLELVYNFGQSAFYEWLNVTNPTRAPLGTYKVAVEEGGCRYELDVSVQNVATRNATVSFCNYKMDNTSAFTTNSFRSIVADKQGNMWAGADGNGTTGGLYLFSGGGAGCNQGSWSRSNEFTTSTYRDLHISPLPGDNSVWCASSGYNLAEAITGGVYRINSLSSVTRFGSVLDDVGGGTLGSRLANSLAIAPNGKLYVGLGVSQTAAGTLGEGDVYETNLNTAPGTFVRTNLTNANVSDRRVSAVGMRGTELWAAFQRYCNNGCQDPFIQRWNTLTNSSALTITQENSPIPFSDRNELIVRAIFTASDGRTYVGLSQNLGFAVLAAGPTVSAAWTMVSSDNSAFPLDASVNFNAITEVNGEIWMGTSNGLLIYDGVGPLTDCNSYTLYNTSNGLPNNNVTDVAYNPVRDEVWITHGGGISRINKAGTISGKVLNVFVGAYTNGLLPKLYNRPIADASVLLFDEQGTRVDSVGTDAKGNFDLQNGVKGQLHKVQVKWGSYFYEYEFVSAGAYMGEVIIPDSLIQDLKKLRDSMAFKDIEIKLPGEDTYSLIWKMPPYKVQAFDTTGFHKAYEAYKGKITDRHFDRVYNLAIYYVSLATVNDIGLLAYDLMKEGIELGWETVASVADLGSALKDLKKFKDAWYTNFGTATRADKKAAAKLISEAMDESKKNVLDNLREILADLLKEEIREKLDTSGKLVYDGIQALVNQVLDQMISTLVEDKDEVANLTTEGFKDLIADVAKEIVQKILGVAYLKYYTLIMHENLIKSTATSANTLRSAKQYPVVYDAVYKNQFLTPETPPSVRQKAIEQSEDAMDQIELEKDLASSDSAWTNGIEALSVLALETVVFAEATPILRSIGFGLQALNAAIHGVAAGTALVNGAEVGLLSKNVVGETGFPPAMPLLETLNTGTCLPLPTAALAQAHANYALALNQLRTAVGTGFDSLAFSPVYTAFLQAEEQYSHTLATYTRSITPRLESAAQQNPTIKDELTFLEQQVKPRLHGSRAALNLEMINYVLNDDKNYSKPRLLELLSDTRNASYEATSLLQGIWQKMNTNCAKAFGYAIQTAFKDSGSYKPGSSGKISYTYTNYGAEPVAGLSFRISNLTNGFTLLSSDSVFAGSLAPGSSVTFSYAYSIPAGAAATSGYTITPKASAGFVQAASGVLKSLRSVPNTEAISVKNGNWNDPATWNTGQVPVEITAVTIRHNVTVDIDATCKTLKAENPAQVQVAAGKKLKVLQ